MKANFRKWLAYNYPNFEKFRFLKDGTVTAVSKFGNGKPFEFLTADELKSHKESFDREMENRAYLRRHGFKLGKPAFTLHHFNAALRSKEASK